MIIKRNSLSPPFTLREGQLLKISPRRTHIVRVTDSIYSISQRYAVSQFQLAQLNELEPPFELQVGQQLQLPNTQDFSVLDTGLPSGVSSTNVVQPKPTSTNATPSLNKRKRFVAPTENDNGFRWPVEGEIVKEFRFARGIRNDGINIAAKEGTGFERLQKDEWHLLAIT